MSVSLTQMAATVLVTSIVGVGMANKAKFDAEETMGLAYGTLLYQVANATQNYVDANLTSFSTAGAETEITPTSAAYPGLYNRILSSVTSSVPTDNTHVKAANGGNIRIAVTRKQANGSQFVACTTFTPATCPYTFAKVWVDRAITTGTPSLHTGAALLKASNYFAGMSYDGSVSNRNNIKTTDPDTSYSLDPQQRNRVRWTAPNPLAGTPGIAMAITDYSSSAFRAYFRKNGSDTMEGSFRMGGFSIEEANTLTLSNSGRTGTALDIASGNARIAGTTTVAGTLIANGAATLNSVTANGAANLGTSTVINNGVTTITGTATVSNASGAGTTNLNGGVGRALKLNLSAIDTVSTSTDANAVTGNLLMIDNNNKVIKSKSSLKQFSILNFKFNKTYLDVLWYDTRIPVDEYTLIVVGHRTGVSYKMEEGMSFGSDLLKAVPATSVNGKKTWWLTADSRAADTNIDKSVDRFWEINTLVVANDMVVDRGCVTEDFGRIYDELAYNNTRQGANPMTDRVAACF